MVANARGEIGPAEIIVGMFPFEVTILKSSDSLLCFAALLFLLRIVEVEEARSLVLDLLDEEPVEEPSFLFSVLGGSREGREIVTRCLGDVVVSLLASDLGECFGMHFFCFGLDFGNKTGARSDDIGLFGLLGLMVFGLTFLASLSTGLSSFDPRLFTASLLGRSKWVSAEIWKLAGSDVCLFDNCSLAISLALVMSRGNSAPPMSVAVPALKISRPE